MANETIKHTEEAFYSTDRQPLSLSCASVRSPISREIRWFLRLFRVIKMSSNGHHVDDGGESSSVMSGTSSFSTTDDMDEESRIPPWKKWSDSMKCLLEDPTGCGLFQKFLTEENLGGAFLFYHACKGLKSQEKTKQHKLQLIRAIQEKFVLTPHVLPLHEDTKMMLVEKFESLRKGLVADSELVNFFDGAQEEAWSIMERDHYPNFISSETYQHYINSQEKVSGMLVE